MPFLRISIMLFLIGLVAAAPAAAQSNDRVQPNIVVILVDDMGFSDLGCYGSEIQTPTLDALAGRGLRFTQFYNTGRCCPTRAALLTGLYPHQAGVGHMSEDDGLAGYTGALNDSTQTLAEVARSAGYFTAMAGKWHVGNNHGQMPTQRGFDRFFGSDLGGIYYDLTTLGNVRRLYLNDGVFAEKNSDLPEGFYSTHAFVDYGIRFIDEARQQDKPFFLYLAHIAPHFPLQAPEETIAKYRGKYQAGWDKLAAARHARQTEMGLVHDWAPASRPEQVAAWDSLSDQEKDRFDHIMSVYAATIEEMDKSIGTLVGALKERGALENTVILFMSDNGGCAERGPNGVFEFEEDTPYPGGPGSKIWCGMSWAWMQNTPFRQYKHYVHEGGIATPLIVHWPAGIDDSAEGSLVAEYGHVIDIMPTLVELADATYPEAVDGRPISPMQGVSLVRTFQKDARPQRRLFWEHEGNRAVRDGDWKLVARGINGPWELYNLAEDRTEIDNIASHHPDRFNDLSQAWEQWAVEAQVYPMPKRNYWKGKQGPAGR